MSTDPRQAPAGPPERSEAAPYYFGYIDRVSGPDVVSVLREQLVGVPTFLRGISEERSLHRYQAGKWSIREVLSHVSDCERVFLSRAFWFARGFDSPLPSFDQDVSAAAAGAHDVPWAGHIDDFQAVRQATLTLFQNLRREAWTRTGVASGNPFTVRALAYIIAGHLEHHLAILRERYL